MLNKEKGKNPKKIQSKHEKKMEEEYFNYTQIKSQIRGIFLLKKKMIYPKGFDEGSSSPVGRCR